MDNLALSFQLGNLIFLATLNAINNALVWYEVQKITH